jgi:hypothetical protein
MEAKKFKCQDLETDFILIEKVNQEIVIEFNSKKYVQWVNLSKTDAIEFCREILKQISLLE